MSEVINNREYRQKTLKEIIRQLHEGKGVEDVKARFEALIEGVSAHEIAEMEQALVREGMPVSEIQNLCDVHASVFKGSIEDIHREVTPEETPGHPIHTFRLENRAIEKLIDGTIRPLIERLPTAGGPEAIEELREALEMLAAVDRHYARKENLLFPFLEKYGITAPPKVMWGVDDEIRAALKRATGQLNQGNSDRSVIAYIGELADRMTDMIFKEEKILFPMALETLSEDEWHRILKDSDEVGYCLIQVRNVWKPANENIEGKLRASGAEPSGGFIQFDPGALTPEEIKGMLNTLPVDITFVDKDGAVKYFSQGKERIFPRPASTIGRHVSNCHPPASVQIVEQIVADLRSGKKEHEDFWIHMGPKYVYIRYFAVRNNAGEFLGIMELTQDIGPIQDITGEKRLMTE